MPTTTDHNLPYPSPVGVAPDVPYWLQQLAEATDTAVDDPMVPHAVMSRSAALGTAIPNAAYTPLPFDVVESTRELTTTAATGRVTVTRTGLYLAAAGIVFATSATGVRYAALFRNGSPSQSRLFGTTGAVVAGSAPLWLTAGDYVECHAYQNSGAALNLAGPFPATFFSLHYLGR